MLWALPPVKVTVEEPAVKALELVQLPLQKIAEAPAVNAPPV